MNLSAFLLAAAQRLMPSQQREWADAMRLESIHVAERERLRWSLGCFWSALRMRLDPMNTGNFRVSRWVMLIETIGAFGPVTFAWFEGNFGASGIVRLNGEIIDKFFLGSPGGRTSLR